MRLHSSCRGTFDRGGKLRAHFTETNQLQALGLRRAGDYGLQACPRVGVAERVRPASPSCGHSAWGAPVGRAQAGS